MDEELEAALAALDSETLGRRLKDARLAAGLTQPEAAGVDASAAYLSRIERGERRPGIHLLTKLAARLNVDLSLIIRGVADIDVRATECAVNFAELALLAGAPQDALTRVDDLLNSNLLDGQRHLTDRILLVKARAQAALGRTDDVIVALEELARREPVARLHAEIQFRLCLLLRETGDLARSIAVGEEAMNHMIETKASPEDVIRVAVVLAGAHRDNGDNSRALATCRQAVDLSRSTGSPVVRASAYTDAAIAEADEGRLDESLDLARRALSLFENNSDLRLNAQIRTQLGELLLNTGRSHVPEALDHLQFAIEALSLASVEDSEQLQTHVTLARAFLAAGDPAAAKAEATRCLEVGRDLPFIAATASSLLGQIAVATGDRSLARQYLLESLQHLHALGPDRRAAQLWFNLAASLDEVELPDEAKSAYRRAAECTGLTPTAGDRS